MYLVQLLLPVRDNKRRPLSDDLRRVAAELTDRFGGLTAYTRSPADGRWQSEDGQTDRDEIVVYEVMAETLDSTWWGDYRRDLDAGPPAPSRASRSAKATPIVTDGRRIPLAANLA